MLRLDQTGPFVRKRTVETPSLPAPDQRWSGVLVLSLVDDRIAGWELHELRYAMSDGHEPYRFELSDLECYMPDVVRRVRAYAETWVKQTYSQKRETEEQ